MRHPRQDKALTSVPIKMFVIRRSFLCMKDAEKILHLASVKIRSKNMDFFTLTNHKSKVQVSDSSINYFVWVQKKCNKQLCTKLNCDWAKAIFNLQISFSLAKKEVSKAFHTHNCTFKKVGQSAWSTPFSSWLVTSVKLNRELLLKQSCQSTVKKCLKERPSTCENVMLLRK